MRQKGFKVHLLFLFFATVLLLIFTPLALYAQDARGSKEIQDVSSKPRSILVVDFVNQQKIKDFQYLATTIASSMSDSIATSRNTTSETLENLTGQPAASNTKLKGINLYDNETAVKLGYEAKADIVIIGNYVVMDKKILVQCRAVDVKRSTVLASKARYWEISSNIFTDISKLSDDMRIELDKTLTDTIEKEKKLQALYQTWENRRLYASYNAGFGIPVEHLGSALSAAFNQKVLFSYALSWYNPIFFSLTSGISFSTMQKASAFPTDLSYNFFHFFAGVELAIPLNIGIPLSIHIIGAGGYALSSLYRGLDLTTYKSRDPGLLAALEFRYEIIYGITATLYSNYERIFFPGVDFVLVTFGLGAGYRLDFNLFNQGPSK